MWKVYLVPSLISMLENWERNGRFMAHETSYLMQDTWEISLVHAEQCVSSDPLVRSL